MSDQSFQYQFTVDRRPEVVWAAVSDPKSWWSQEVDGVADREGATFRYHYQDVHRCTFRVTEAVPSRRLVWHVTENSFNFTKDRAEWVGTVVVFELAAKGGGTEVTFTHRGLVPAYECFEICRDAWTGYLSGSLRDLILTGRGQPNPLEDVVARAAARSAEDFELRVHFDLPPAAVMAAVDRPRDWWSAGIEGSFDRPGDEFVFRHEDLHRSVQRVAEKIPGRRTVWLVTEGRISFVNNPDEWTGTELIFEAFPNDGGCELVFTHAGLDRTKECYADCVAGWTYFLTKSLPALVATGTGLPA